MSYPIPITQYRLGGAEGNLFASNHNNNCQLRNIREQFAMLELSSQLTRINHKAVYDLVSAQKKEQQTNTY